MRSARISFWGSVLLFVLLSGSTIVPNASWAELAGLDLARTVALGWTEVIIRQKGHWSGSRKPTVSSIEPVRQDGSLVGYYAKIDPMGFIVLSADTELPPVNAYSTRGQFDINAEALPIRALRYKLLDQNQGIDTYKRLKQQRDPSIEAPDHGETWSILSGTGTLTKGTASRMDYLGGQTLLSTLWNQTPPYNARCPNKNCNQHTCLNAYDLNSVVGCVGLAGAQVMRYWSWPPYGENSPYNVWYDWRNMPDKLECDSPQAEIDAVSELCFLVGHAAGTDYGCSGSGAMFSGCPGCGDLLDTFEDHYFYSEDADDQGRDFIIDPFGTMWFETIMDEVNKNRPVPYAFSTSWLEGHTVVVDGWQIVGS